ncbi:MAG: tetratricopeptide repeat protein [Ignavibacteria bacterium]|nr:tetratricopeptide repeat protein [Ignavibacteria bacterium]
MIGSTISHYRIIEKLGEGGMGVVYKAEDTKLKRTVALKFLPPQLTQDEEAKSRFVHEAQAASGLDHPSICTIHEIDQTEDGRMFVSMAYYGGEPLNKHLAQGRFNPDETVRLATEIAKGLARAHDAGVVHRDIKPGNIMLTQHGEAKIVDFGLAKLAGVSRFTREGVTVGTTPYMSPEQARGDDVDHRSDVWSLGVVMYEMLSGTTPFKGEYDQVILYSILNQSPTDLSTLVPDLPPELGQIIGRCLKKDLNDRYQRAAELVEDLENYQRGKKKIPTRSWRLNGFFGTPRTRTLTWSLAAVVAIIAASFAIAPIREGWKSFFGFPSIPEARYIAVLPFTNVGGGTENEAFSNGIVERLTSRLSQLERFQGSLWVVPAVEIYRRNVASPSEAKNLFGATLAVSGSVQRNRESIQISLNLLDASSMRQLRSSIIEGRVQHLGDLEESVLIALIGMLEMEVPPAVRARVAMLGTRNSEAHDLYLKGRGYLQRYREKGNLEKAIDLFKDAVAEDSTYAEAFAGLGEAYWRQYEITNDVRWVDQAIQNSTTAQRLNDKLLAVHLTLGLVYNGTGRPVDAEREFRSALTLDPVSAQAYQGLARALEIRGDVAASEETYRRAVELRPAYATTHNDLGTFLARLGKYEAAAHEFRAVVEIAPGAVTGYRNLGGMYWYMNRRDEAVRWFLKALELEPDYRTYSNLATLYYYEGKFSEVSQMYQKALEISDKDYRVWGYLAAAYVQLPDREKARDAYARAIKMGEERRTVNAREPELLVNLAGYYAAVDSVRRSRELLGIVISQRPTDISVLYVIGTVYETLGNRAEALRWIGRAIEKGYSIQEINANPELRELRKDPKFAAILKR